MKPDMMEVLTKIQEMLDGVIADKMFPPEESGMPVEEMEAAEGEGEDDDLTDLDLRLAQLPAKMDLPDEEDEDEDY